MIAASPPPESWWIRRAPRICRVLLGIALASACSVGPLAKAALFHAEALVAPVHVAGTDVQALRFAIGAIQVPEGDAQRDLMERARTAALLELERVRDTPFVGANAATLTPSAAQLESATQDYGEFAGQYWTQWLLRLIGSLQVMGAQCVSPEDAAMAATQLSEAVYGLCAELEQSEAKGPIEAVAALRRGADELAERLRAGRTLVARRAVDRASMRGFLERLRAELAVKQPAAALTPRRGGPSPQMVQDAYTKEFDEDPCVAAARELQAAWASENQTLITDFTTVERETFGQPMEAFMANRSARLRHEAPASLQQRLATIKAEEAAATLEAARLSCLLAIGGAAVEVLDTAAKDHDDWQPFECTISWTPSERVSGAFVASCGAVARRQNGVVEVRIGLVRATGREQALPLDLAGASLRVQCDSSADLEIRGFATPSSHEAWVRQSFHALVCGARSGGAEVSARLCGLRTMKYPMLGHGFAYGGAALRAAAIAPADPAALRAEVLQQSALIQSSRGLLRATDEERGSAVRVALDAIERGDGASACATAILRASLLRQLAAAAPNVVEGGVFRASARLFDLLGEPAESAIRAFVASTDAGTAPLLLLDPEAAPMVWQAIDGQADCRQAPAAIIGAMIAAFDAAGLSKSEARDIVERTHRALRTQGVPECLIADRWALSSVALIAQASGAAALRDADSRRPAMDALEWMLLSAGERLQIGGEERREAWNAALAPLRSQLEQLTDTESLDASAKADLRAHAGRFIGGLRWRAGYPCFPPLNFDPAESWVAGVIERSAEKARQDIERVSFGAAARWPTKLTAQERHLAIGFVACRMYEGLLAEPDLPAVPQGHGAASCPTWAESLALAVQDPGSPVLTVQRRP